MAAAAVGAGFQAPPVLDLAAALVDLAALSLTFEISWLMLLFAAELVAVESSLLRLEILCPASLVMLEITLETLAAADEWLAEELAWERIELALDSIEDNAALAELVTSAACYSPKSVLRHQWIQ